MRNETIEKRIREESRDGTTFLVRYHDAEDLIRDHTAELSSGRIFLPVPSERAAGDAVTLKVSFPGLLRPLSIDGVVTARVRKKTLRGLTIELAQEIRDHLAFQVARIEQNDPDYVVRMIRVLVVEDNPHFAKLIQEGLHLAERRVFGNRVAFDVPTASTTTDALAFLGKKPIDILVADVYVGGMNGSTIIEHVRANDALRSIPVIAVAEGQDNATRGVAITAGADVFLEKPLRLKQLVDAVGRMLALEPLNESAV